MHVIYRERPVSGGAHTPHGHQILLAQGADGPRSGESETPRNEGDVCGPFDEAAAGCTIQVRKRRAYGLGHNDSSLDYYNNICLMREK